MTEHKSGWVYCFGKSESWTTAAWATKKQALEAALAESDSNVSRGKDAEDWVMVAYGMATGAQIACRHISLNELLGVMSTQLKSQQLIGELQQLELDGERGAFEAFGRWIREHIKIPLHRVIDPITIETVKLASIPKPDPTPSPDLRKAEDRMRFILQRAVNHNLHINGEPVHVNDLETFVELTQEKAKTELLTQLRTELKFAGLWDGITKRIIDGHQ